MARIRKLTPQMLRRLVLQERRKIRETSDPVAAGVEDPEKVNAEEVGADEFAGSLEKDIDYLKALKIHERRLRSKLKRVSEAKGKVKRRLIKKI